MLHKPRDVQTSSKPPKTPGWKNSFFVDLTVRRKFPARCQPDGTHRLTFWSFPVVRVLDQVSLNECSSPVLKQLPRRANQRRRRIEVSQNCPCPIPLPHSALITPRWWKKQKHCWHKPMLPSWNILATLKQWSVPERGCISVPPAQGRNGRQFPPLAVAFRLGRIRQLGRPQLWARHRKRHEHTAVSEDGFSGKTGERSVDYRIQRRGGAHNCHGFHRGSSPRPSLSCPPRGHEPDRWYAA